jgi:CBS domain containing-hemolysin-like protein
VSSTSFRILLVILIVAVNGFFAAAEAALLSVRQSRLRQMAEQGHAGAQAALSLLANPGRLLSVTQVGVTLASLGLGWAGEQTVYEILVAALQPVTSAAAEGVLHGVSFVLAFLVISYFHVVVGEVLPKNLAIAKAARLAALVAPPLLVFDRVSRPFVVVIERSAAALSRAMGVSDSAHAGGHSADELKLIVSSSRGLGFLPEAQEEMIHRVLDLGAIQVREIMVPRQNMVSLAADASLDQVLRIMSRERHSRYPVFETGTDKLIGFLLYKDLLPVWEDRRRAIRAGRASRTFQLARILRPAMVVPETKPASQMLEEFRQGHSHMAMVVDEFGTITGLLTVEDVLEQLVGRIEDEHDDKPAPRTPLEMDEVELDGTTRIRDLEAEYGIALPAEGGFETLAGFLLLRFGEIPHAGASLEHDGRRFTVLEMERNRIALVRIEKLPQAAVPDVA